MNRLLIYPTPAVIISMRFAQTSHVGILFTSGSLGFIRDISNWGKFPLNEFALQRVPLPDGNVANEATLGRRAQLVPVGQGLE